ncbi:Metalloenzyme, LuxS/M16 peptidase-like protein [Kickxella alabastrina]|uniref:Metalloenzyme, LuxS/M16 peptidase-like protein n=1 Tax=Kickxella alabastrina TaxID=61397 RepID=UPI00221FE2EC|nr:Metalloenzyme, LuxS/M16 peptidase-like protein [Kickxella alabastrina]KAI7820588.1 Metalloenzyme, LuxS/M16 peptidase-like protein [Kickxella alabastrina]
MQSLANRIFTKMHTKLLVVGNLHQADALQVANIVQAGFASAPLHNPATGNLLIKILSEPFFDQIRNKEQLGYAVNISSVRVVNGRRIIKFSVQGKNSPAYMALRVDRFIYNARQTLHEYSSRKLARLVESIVNTECEKAGNPGKQVDAIWNKISSGSYKFGQKNDIVKHLKNVTKDDLLMFWDTHISPKLAPAYTFPQPTKPDMHLYPAEIIALHSCLYNLGATSISVNRLCAAVNLAAKNCNSADILMGRLEKFLDDKPFLNFTPVLKTQLKTALVLCLAK